MDANSPQESCETQVALATKKKPLANTYSTLLREAKLNHTLQTPWHSEILMNEERATNKMNYYIYIIIIITRQRSTEQNSCSSCRITALEAQRERVQSGLEQ